MADNDCGTKLSHTDSFPPVTIRRGQDNAPKHNEGGIGISMSESESNYKCEQVAIQRSPYVKCTLSFERARFFLLSCS